MNEHYLETKRTIDAIDVKNIGNLKKKCAIFVMVQNEEIFLPLWLRYYSKYFDGDDIFVFDHRSTDSSVKDSLNSFQFQTIRLDYPYSFDHQWFQFVAENTQKKLLEFYEYVIFTDIDEILFVNSRNYNGLDDYIHKLDLEYVRCVGYDLIHMKDKEKIFKTGKPVLSQRKYWYRTILYDKTLLSRCPLNWKIGFHGVTKENSNQDPDLLLIHLHKLDFDMCRKKSFERSKLPWSESDVQKNWGWQNRITDFEKFTEYFYNWPSGIEITKIPRGIRKSRQF
jgi:hypothetical protein